MHNAYYSIIHARDVTFTNVCNRKPDGTLTTKVFTISLLELSKLFCPQSLDGLVIWQITKPSSAVNFFLLVRTINSANDLRRAM